MTKTNEHPLAASIYAMIVDEEYRGRGYGTKLINEAIDKSKQQGQQV